MTPELTLPGSWYGDPALHQRLIDLVFAASWQVGPGLHELGSAGEVVPWRLAPGTVDEPVLTARLADGSLRTLSNVCTHRGALLVDGPCKAQRLRCPYHGRRFSLTGALEAAPGFEGQAVEGDLPSLRTATVGPLVLATLGDAPALQEAAGSAWDRLRPLIERPMVAAAGEAFDIPVNWMLYVENYLEGLHVPYVHPELAGAIELRSYAVEVLPRGVLQVALSADGCAFDLPPGHPDHGRPIAAYYLWLFPDLMLNLYPWGLSLNHVQPQGPRGVRVVYRRWIADPTRLDQGAGGDLQTVEQQDQQVIQRVQAGVGARLYRSGTYAPRHEDGVRAFHRWVRDAARGG
jgi:choline monooxygenase